MERCPKSALTILGLCGSLRGDSSATKRVLQIALDAAAQTEATVEMIDLNDYRLINCDGLPQQSKTLNTVPNDVEKLKQKVMAAKGVIIATPEYHNSFSGVLKNALDLMGTPHFKGKIIGLIGVSGGQMGGLMAVNQLRDISRSLHAWVIPDQACVPTAWKNVDTEKGEIKDEGLKKRVEKVGMEVAKYAYLHANLKSQEFLDSIESGVFNPAGSAKE